MKQIKKQKKGQVITVSILTVIFIFLLVLTLFFDSLITRPLIANDKTKILESEATRLSDSLLLTGYPENWHESNIVQKIGLTTNNVLDIQKIKNFSEIAEDNYESTKILLGIQNDYHINISYVEESQQITTIIPKKELTQTNFMITRQRTTLIQTNNKKIPVTIHITLYSN